MAKHMLLMLANPVEGHEDEFNRWYEERHVPDLLRVPGFKTAQRFVLSDVQRTPPPHPYRYLALYEIETDDLQMTISEMLKRAGTADMVISDALDTSRLGAVFRPITEKIGTI